MGRIRIYSDTQKGCIFFDNTTIEPKFLGTVVAEVKADEPDRIHVFRTDRYRADGITFRTIFKRLKPGRVNNFDQQNLVVDLGYSTQQVVDYINEQATSFQPTTPARPDLDDTPNFTIDETGTSIMIDNGEAFGINTLKAVLQEDGLIDIMSSDFSGNAITYYEDVDPTTFQIAGSPLSGGPSDVVNQLNELFTAGPFEAVVIADPYATMVADQGGVATTYTLEGIDAIDPDGPDLATSTKNSHRAGIKTVETINEPGEFFTFQIRGEGQIGFGLIHSQASYDAGHWSGNSTYANPAQFKVGNSQHFGFQFSHHFHPTPNGPWTNYGANTAFSIRSGWTGSTDRFISSDEGADWLAGNPVKIKVGIDANSFISIEYWNESQDRYIPISRSGYPVPEGAEFHLGVSMYSPLARLHSVPRVHLLDEQAPTMYFRYIESPDGNFIFPLFATEEEANYWNLVKGGSGTSHSHTYPDDPTGTTWYMSDDPYNGMPGYHTNPNDANTPATNEFDGNIINWTEITSLTNADLRPSQFTNADLTYEEGTVVNLQLQPADTVYTTSVDISPAGSGLVYNSYNKMLQGTLSDVSSDTVYTITVTRANSYGSTVGSFTITATDETPANTQTTPYNRALDFSGGNEYAVNVVTQSAQNPTRLPAAQTIPGNTTAGYTSPSGRPWATAIVFRSDRNNSNQHIWNQGEGAGTYDDNIYLRQDSSGYLYFGWGRSGATNELRFAGPLVKDTWYGIYIAHTGERLDDTAATAANLADCFDIRLMKSFNGTWEISTAGGAEADGNRSTAANWSATPASTGYGMDFSVDGYWSIGGRRGNRNFHGKVASCVRTTLLNNAPMPDSDEVLEMTTDPMQWLTDYKEGNNFRQSHNQGSSSWDTANLSAKRRATQVWLMGDGTADSYSNMIRNQVDHTDQNDTKLNLNSMVSNDIETVNVPGLS